MQAKKRKTINFIHSDNGMCRKLQRTQGAYWSYEKRIPVRNKWTLWTCKKLSKNDQWEHKTQGLYVCARKRWEKVWIRAQEKKWKGILEICWA